MLESDFSRSGELAENIAIKSLAANLIRQMHEKYPDLPPAKKGDWTFGQVISALVKNAAR